MRKLIIAASVAARSSDRRHGRLLHVGRLGDPRGTDSRGLGRRGRRGVESAGHTSWS
jgi:hypothetical protein